MYVRMCAQHFQQIMDKPGIVAIPARGELNRLSNIFPVAVST